MPPAAKLNKSLPAAKKDCASKETRLQRKDCCKTSGQFLRINDSFHPVPGKISVKPVQVESVIVFDYIKNEILIHTNLNLFNSDLPPPDTGRKILVALHQLKLDPHWFNLI